MSLHPLSNPTPPRGRRRFAIPCILAAVAVTAAAIGIANAADPVPQPGAVAASPAVSDVALARSALAALDADPDLKGVNLVVSVVDRVAVIGGPVATAKQSRRAEEIVRAVRGVADVRNTCFVTMGPDPLLRAVAERVSSLPPRPTMYELPGVLTNHLTPPAPAEPAPPSPGATVAAADPPGTIVARKPSTEPGVLGAPVGPAGSGIVRPAPAVPHATPGVLTGNASGVLHAAGEMKKAEARFARLTLELRDGTLVVGGSAPLASDAWDLAKKLQAVPGVSRIAVAAVAQK